MTGRNNVQPDLGQPALCDAVAPVAVHGDLPCILRGAALILDLLLIRP